MRKLIISFTIFSSLSLFGYYYIPYKIKQIIVRKIKRAARAKGIDIENVYVDLKWSNITLTNIKLKGINYTGKINKITIADYKIKHILPLEVTLGDIYIKGLGIEGEKPNFKNSSTKTYGGGSVKWNKIHFDGIWLDLTSSLGNIDVEDGTGIYTRGLGGEFSLSQLSVQSPRIPVTDIASAKITINKNHTLKKVNLNSLVVNINKEFRFFTKSIKLIPQTKKKLSFEINGKLLNNKGAIKAKGTLNPQTHDFSANMKVSDAKISSLFSSNLPLEDRKKLNFSGSLFLKRNKKSITGNYNGNVSNLSVYHKMIAKKPLRDLFFNVNFDFNYKKSKDLFFIPKGNITYGKVKSKFNISIEKLRQTPLVNINFSIPQMLCKDVMHSLPKPLFPHITKFKMGGLFNTDLHLKIDFSNLNRHGVKLNGKVNLNKCFVKRAPYFFRASRIRHNFDYTLREPGGQRVLVSVDDEDEFFTPLDKISPFMIQAVLTTEDGRFYRHHGFIPSEFSSALAKNLKARKFKWGASSITMQIVKNVFLKREKTLSRKLEELFLTWYIERHVSKRRLMEIYLNIIELGPDIYGVTKASRHFFGKEPEDLTAKESIYFASILPSPKKRYRYYCKGELSSYWNRYLNRLLKIMKRRQRITLEEYNSAIIEDIKFDHTNFEGKYQCRRLIRRYRGY